MVRRLCLLLTLVASAAGCGQKNAFVPPPPPQVTVAKPVERDVADSLEFTGWTEATAKVDLRARVNGYLEKVLFDDGAMVKKGQLLFVIDQTSFKTALASANAELAKAQAALKLEQSEYARTEPLVRQGAQTQADLDVASAELLTAQANVTAADAAVRQATSNLGYTEIKAPIKGRIGRHLVDEGNLVQMEQTSLAVIESYDPIYGVFSVSEDELLQYLAMTRESGVDAAELKKNPPVLYMGLKKGDNFPIKGHFDFSERTIDRETGTAIRRGVFDNADQVLVPGLKVRFKAPLGEPRPRLMVEERAVSVDQRGDYLLVVDDNNTVQYRPVKLGQATGGMRVVESGVTADDWIVVNGLQRARPGTPVNPTREGEEAGAKTE
jgi:RND family efflux transporter MFP subunit